jgi:hypothetical protein
VMPAALALGKDVGVDPKRYGNSCKFVNVCSMTLLR